MRKQNEQKEREKNAYSQTKFKVKILGSECQTSGTYAKRAKHATKKTIA
jgi:hypothetical protein